MVLDATLLNTQHYKVRITGKVEQSREWSSTLLYTFWSPSTTVANFTFFTYIYIYIYIYIRDLTLNYPQGLICHKTPINRKWLLILKQIVFSNAHIYNLSVCVCVCVCGIHWLHIYRKIRHLLTSVLDITLNNLMMRLQHWRFGDCGVTLHRHCSQVHSDQSDSFW